MKASKIAHSAQETVFALTHNWFLAGEARALVEDLSDEKALNDLTEQINCVKQERLRQFLQAKLGYTPSDLTIQFIKEYNL